MDPMSPVSQANRLNNEGIDLFSTKCLSRASSCFGQALSQIEGYLKTSSKYGQSYCQATCDVQRYFEAGDHYWSLTDEDFFVFGCPLVVEQLNAVDDQERQAVILASTIMFNLALTYHVLSLTLRGDPRKKSVILKKASSLYELAHSLHIDEEISQSQVEAMVMLNNMSHVYATVGASDKAVECASDLLSKLMVLLGQVEECRANVIFEGFFATAMNVLTGTSRFSAAAA